MTGNTKHTESSLRNNIMIVFFLLITIWGSVLTVFFHSVLKGTLLREGLPPVVIANINRHFLFISTGFTIIGIVVVLLTAYLISRAITKPLMKLKEGTDILSSGNLDYRVDIKSSDETGQLADSFNQMVDTLKDVTVSRDELAIEVSEREKAEKALKAFAVRLEQSNRELQDFAYVASHDLQEPLRKVTGFGGRLKERYSEVLGDKGKDYIDRMMNAASRMQMLIDGLLDYSRVTTKAQPYVPVNLSTVAGEVLSDLEMRIEQTGAQIEVDQLPTIDADPLQMRQLFQNLLGNALKFHKPGEPPFIKVTNEQPGDHNHECISSHKGTCRVTIGDNGIGFDEKHTDRIFGVFQRLHGRSEYEGTGIGLSVCRKIVERHGGSIEAHSRSEEGATFTVVLPVKHEQADET